MADIFKVLDLIMNDSDYEYSFELRKWNKKGTKEYINSEELLNIFKRKAMI